MSRLEAPSRNRSGVSQSGPAVSCTRTRLRTASLAVRIPPAGFTPITWPVAACQSRTASSSSRVNGRVAAGETLPVLVLTKSAPAAIASQDARRTLS